MLRAFEMKTLAALFTLFAACLVFETAALAVECGEETCEQGAMCIDRGTGEQCWALCRFNHECESECCIQIRYPYTAWICGDASECGVVEDGDEPLDGDTVGDGDSSSDSDGDNDEEQDNTPYEPVECGDEWCSSAERCVSFEGEPASCAPKCSRAVDCNSQCCVETYASVPVCMPEGLDCPRDKRVKVDPICQQVGSERLGWWLLILGYFALRRKRRMENQNG
jgi:MYXO-CTERM domain-containing protein